LFYKFIHPIDLRISLGAFGSGVYFP